MFPFSKKTQKIKDLEKAGLPISAIESKIKNDIFPNQKLFIIDDSLLFVQRAGFASDYSFHHLLFDKNQKELCSYADNFAGPKLECSDLGKKELFDTIIKNLDKPSLGLLNHKVELVNAISQQDAENIALKAVKKTPSNFEKIEASLSGSRWYVNLIPPTVPTDQYYYQVQIDAANGEVQKVDQGGGA